MFLAGTTKSGREAQVLRFLRNEPSISLLLAAVNFEWTLCRAVLFFSRRPNAELRELMKKFYSLKTYKELWKLEIVDGRNFSPLAMVVNNWSSVCKAFDARNRLVHGKDRYTRNMATPHVNALLEGAGYIDDYCALVGYPLFKRMPVRRRAHSSR